MAEQLGLEQGFRDGAAVEGDEPLAAPRAGIVNRPRRQLLARASLARDEHRAGRGRNRSQQLEQPVHHRRAADHPVDLELVVELRAQVGVLRAQAALLERDVELVQQLLERKRLRDEPFSAQPRDLDRLFQRAVPADHDRQDVRIAGKRFVEHLPAVDAGQPQVGHEDIERKFAQPLQRVFAGAGLLHFESVLGESLGNHLAKCRFVIDQKKVQRRVRH